MLGPKEKRMKEQEEEERSSEEGGRRGETTGREWGGRYWGAGGIWNETRGWGGWRGKWAERWGMREERLRRDKEGSNGRRKRQDDRETRNDNSWKKWRDSSRRKNRGRRRKVEQKHKLEKQMEAKGKEETEGYEEKTTAVPTVNRYRHRGGGRCGLQWHHSHQSWAGKIATCTWRLILCTTSSSFGTQSVKTVWTTSTPGRSFHWMKQWLSIKGPRPTSSDFSCPWSRSRLASKYMPSANPDLVISFTWRCTRSLASTWNISPCLWHSPSMVGIISFTAISCTRHLP